MERRGNRDQQRQLPVRRRRTAEPPCRPCSSRGSRFFRDDVAHERISGPEILDFAAVSDVFELAARLADVAKSKRSARIPARPIRGRERSAFRYSCSTPCRGRESPRRSNCPARMMQHAAQSFAAQLRKKICSCGSSFYSITDYHSLIVAKSMAERETAHRRLSVLVGFPLNNPEVC